MRTLLLALAVGACGTDPLQPPTGDIVHYKVDEQRFPGTNTEAREFGLDLDDDDAPDNQLGVVYSGLIGRDADPRVNVATKLTSGEVNQLVDLQYARVLDPDDSIALTLIDASTGEQRSSEPLLGERDEKLLGPGTAAIAFAFFDQLVQLDLIGARVRIDSVDSAQLVASIAGGLRRIDIETQLAPAFQRFMMTRVARDCSALDEPVTCGCTDSKDGYGGHYWLGAFDTTPKDCTISVEEVLSNQLTIALIAPDYSVDDEPLLSMAFAIHATAL